MVQPSGNAQGSCPRSRQRARVATGWALAALGTLLLSLLGLAAVAQQAENSQDPLGVAIPYPVVHLVHSHDPGKSGASADLRSRDPFLFYQTGRDLLHRQFELRHGAYGRAASLDVPLYVEPANSMVHGASARFARDHAASCGMCHSSVYREPSSGQTIGSTGGLGRNTTHFYGAGLVEMLGEQIRAEVLERYDENRNGVIDRAEVSGPRPVRIRPSPGGPEVPEIDYGDLSPGADGVPQLNTLFRVWYLDREGRLLRDAVSLADPRAAAFGFVVQPFGWGRGYGRIAGRLVSQGGESATTREFYTVAADFHMGLQADDPTQVPQLPGDGGASGFGGLARMSLNGAQQFDFGGAVDQGKKRATTGLSLDDPDGDGHPSELTEGDVDAVEFYILHTPPPAVRPTERSEEGRPVLAEVGCTRCHVENWRIEARDERRGLAGDRRFFHLETRSRTAADGAVELEGRLVRLDKVLPSGERVPAGGAFPVERIYSDFKHWDLGPAFWERRFDGSLQKEHRTPPLWGVGSSGPFGHSGTFARLEEVIAAHGGAAAAEAKAYLALPAEKRELLLAYLRSLVLYSTEEIPADVDGDGAVAEDFTVAGQKVGYERFDARFLFARPPAYQRVSQVTYYHGRPKPLLLITNIPQAFGLDLPHRLDGDGDGFPDVVDPLPKQPGVRDEKSTK